MTGQEEKKELTDAQKKRARAKEIADSRNVQEVYSNTKDEFFTVYCNAVNSENGKKENVKTYTFK
ncbi:hypothetical protein [Dysgonomonas sp. 520]|uniref:hypothetical protein n=1 Tax=Dysgonomonas sp. 520 TaxID=2302931 RepID=UPI0013D07730|nr:hypothetical protein [Dysgonomonas sp. 520]NDW10946.1 hypothetical protein [Dysgonomonas sp. 520]